MKNNAKGFSLTELLVVIAIMATLLSLATINFNSWQKKYNIENQAREMMSDLNDLRMRAIQTKSNHMAVLSSDPKLMTFRQYSSEETVNSTNGVEVFRKYYKYPVSNNPTGTPSCNDIKIDPRGFTWSWQTIYIQPTGSGANIDCLVISTSRVNLGQYNGTNCVFK